jgi:SSS family solute:Na+ symporter
MDFIPLLIIIAYFTVSTGVGCAMARRSQNAAGWAVAGSGMSTVMIGFGIAGTRIGGAGTYGVAGDVIAGGVWSFWWYGLNSFLALSLVGVLFAIYYRRLKLHTVGELFTIRWGTRRCQWLTSLCVQTEYAVVNLIEAYIIGAILSTLTPLSMFGGTMVAAVVFSIYVSFGGLWGTALTNLIHCTVVLAGLSTVGVMGVAQFGGWTQVTSLVGEHLQAAGRNETAWWSIIGTGWLPIFAMFFSAVTHTPAASVYTNFATAARTERSIVPAFVLGGIIAGLIPLLAGVIGILTTARYGLSSGLSGYQNLTTLASEINPVVGSIALAAVFAAVISSGGPILLSSATMFVRDWLPVTQRTTSERELRAYRITTTVYAFGAALAAWFMATRTTVSILNLLLFGFAMVVPPAVAIGYVIYYHRTTEQGAFWGMVTGYVGGLTWLALLKLTLMFGFSAPEGASSLRRLLAYCLTVNGTGLDPSYVTFFVPLIVVPIVSLLTTEEKERKTSFYAILSGGAKVEHSRE